MFYDCWYTVEEVDIIVIFGNKTSSNDEVVEVTALFKTICVAILLHFSWILALSRISFFVQDLQAKVMLFTLWGAFFWLYFLLVEKEDITITACVQHKFVYALFVHLELARIGHIERIWTPKAFFMRKLPEWDYAELSGVSGIVWLLLFEVTVSIQYESILVIFDSLACIICPSFITLILSKVFILVDLEVTVIGRCDGVYNLDCDVAILDFGVWNTLSKSIF